MSRHAGHAPELHGGVDVITIGAGPAGLTTARALAAEGFSVLVLEEHAHVGEPVHCTGLLGLDAFDELDLPRDTIRTVLHSARFRGAGGPSTRRGLPPRSSIAPHSIAPLPSGRFAPAPSSAARIACSTWRSTATAWR